MPSLLRVGGYRFFFYSLENGEPPHVHVESSGRTAKFWLDPIELASSERFRAHELNALRQMVLDHSAEFRRRWDEHFS